MNRFYNHLVNSYIKIKIKTFGMPFVNRLNVIVSIVHSDPAVESGVMVVCLNFE